MAEESQPEGSQEARQTPSAAQLSQAWLDATAGFWSAAAGMGAQTAVLGGEWMKALTEISARGASMALPVDPFTLLRQWYEAVNPASARAADELLHSSLFVETAARFMDLYATAFIMQRRQAEAYLQSLRIPTRSDVARVAGLVVALEEKVDRIDDALADTGQLASAASLETATHSLEDRLSRLESKVDRLLTALEALDTRQSPTARESREPQRSSRRRSAPASAAEEVGASARGRSVTEPAPPPPSATDAAPPRRRGRAAARGSTGTQHPAPTRARRRRAETSDATS